MVNPTTDIARIFIPLEWSIALKTVGGLTDIWIGVIKFSWGCSMFDKNLTIYSSIGKYSCVWIVCSQANYDEVWPEEDSMDIQVLITIKACRLGSAVVANIHNIIWSFLCSLLMPIGSCLQKTSSASSMKLRIKKNGEKYESFIKCI